MHISNSFARFYFGISIFLCTHLRWRQRKTTAWVITFHYFFSYIYDVSSKTFCFIPLFFRDEGMISLWSNNDGRNSVNLSYVLCLITSIRKTRHAKANHLERPFHQLSSALAGNVSLRWLKKNGWIYRLTDQETLSRIVWIINVSVSFGAIKMCLIKYNSLSIEAALEEFAKYLLGRDREDFGTDILCLGIWIFFGDCFKMMLKLWR